MEETEDIPLGRPTKYKPEHCIQVEKLCKLGATDTEIADFFEVCRDTISEWKRVYPEFLAAIKKGKIIADAEVANSLFNRAVGFEFNEVTFEKVDSKGILEATEAGEITEEDSYRKKVVTKLFPGDVAAQNIWLKNRRGRQVVKEEEGGQVWADKHEVVNKNVNYDAVNLTPEKIKEINQMLEGEF